VLLLALAALAAAPMPLLALKLWEMLVQQTLAAAVVVAVTMLVELMAVLVSLSFATNSKQHKRATSWHTTH
jgi:negative regulator of sigma E activity